MERNRSVKNVSIGECVALERLRGSCTTWGVAEKCSSGFETYEGLCVLKVTGNTKPERLELNIHVVRLSGAIKNAYNHTGKTSTKHYEPFYLYYFLSVRNTLLIPQEKLELFYIAVVLLLSLQVLSFSFGYASACEFKILQVSYSLKYCLPQMLTVDQRGLFLAADLECGCRDFGSGLL